MQLLKNFKAFSLL